MSIYNEDEKWLSQAIESILNQIYKEIEFIIVCDNPNNQKAIELVKKYKMTDDRIKLIKNEKNIGLAASLNKGYSIANGSYFARMDADDISLENRLFKQIEYFEGNNCVELLSTNVMLIDEDEQVIRKGSQYPDNHDFISETLMFVNIMNHPSWMMKREVFNKLNGYREYPIAQDYDFLLRAKQAGVQFGLLNDQLLKYRVRRNSISGTKLLTRLKYNEELKRRHRTGNESMVLGFNNKDYESKLFELSQKYLKKANYHRFENNMIKSIFWGIISNLLSRHQMKRTYNLLRFRMIAKKYMGKS